MPKIGDDVYRNCRYVLTHLMAYLSTSTATGIPSATAVLVMVSQLPDRLQAPPASRRLAEVKARPPLPGAGWSRSPGDRGG